MIYEKGRDIYLLFNRWGYITDIGEYQRTPFRTKAEALKEFKKIFRAKTGNDWLKIDR